VELCWCPRPWHELVNARSGPWCTRPPVTVCLLRVARGECKSGCTTSTTGGLPFLDTRLESSNRGTLRLFQSAWPQCAPSTRAPTAHLSASNRDPDCRRCLHSGINPGIYLSGLPLKPDFGRTRCCEVGHLISGASLGDGLLDTKSRDFRYCRNFRNLLRVDFQLQMASTP
jgi:hypothetical protein